MITSLYQYYYTSFFVSVSVSMKTATPSLCSSCYWQRMTTAGCLGQDKTGMRLHSNLCSLADSNKHLWQLYTHNRDRYCMLTGCLPGPCKLFGKCNSILHVFSWSLLRQVCTQTCDFTTITDTAQCSAAVLGSCMFVRHLRWTWFEFSWLCFFPCHDSHKHLHDMPGIGLWICCLMGQLPYVFQHMNVFHICDVWMSFICVWFWARQRDMQLYLTCSLQFAALSCIPPGVFALMQ